MERETSNFVLPPQITGIADVQRLARELEQVYDYLHQAALRHDAANSVTLPKASRILNELIQANKLDLSHRDQYEQTVAELTAIEQNAPRIHLSFSTDPSAKFMEQVVAWLRANVHPATLVQVGLQPTLAAGCVVRTTNKQFDISLRQSFVEARPALIERLEQAIAAAPKPAAPAPTQEVAA
jgi:hypothetical protein